MFDLPVRRVWPIPPLAYLNINIYFGVRARNGKYSVNGIMQRIFRSASRRETFGKHSKGGRRDGGLKMDWTKPPPTAWPMCIECRLDLG